MSDHLSPADAAVASRTFPRRFRAVFAPPDDDRADEAEPDELARRVGPDGTSAADHLLAADGVLALLARGLEQVRSDDDPVLHPAVADLAGATWDDPHTPLDGLLDQLEANAVACAERIEAIATGDWSRHVRIAGQDATVEVIDLVRDGIAVVAGHLRAAQRTVDALR